MASNLIIDDLVADLTPVRPIRQNDLLLVAAAIAALTSIAVVTQFGMRHDLAAGNPHPIVIIRSGLLLLLGLATIFSVSATARPAVGNHYNGWKWMLAAVALLPIAALCRFAAGMSAGHPLDMYTEGFYTGPACLMISGASAIVIGGAMTAWLRRGAPTALNHAGWLVGIAAGSFGAFSYNLHCPSDSLYYIGLWYSLAVGMCAAIGRLIVPRLIAW